MRERAVLIVAVIVLFAGLGVWATVADHDRPDEALLATRPPSPPIGEPVASGDEAAADARRALEGAMLGGVPVQRLFARASRPVHGIVVSGRDALGVWERLREGAGERAMWPVIVGDGWDLRAHLDAAAATLEPPERTVARARALDVEAWLADRIAAGAPAEGDWPEEVPAPVERYRVLRDPQIDLPRPEVAVALVPASTSSEAPAWLAFGNWRGCPEPRVHVAVLSRWRERFGAEVVTIGRDTIELRVARPPADRESALALAREQIAYAPALLEDGARSIAEIAASRIGAPVWSFRWPRGEAGPR